MTQGELFSAPAGLDVRVHDSGVPSVEYNYKQDPGGRSGELLPADYQKSAKAAVASYYNQFLMGDLNRGKVIVDLPVIPDDVFIVWFVKVLQNWKALASTVFEDDRYFELTYNGDKRELYVDEYVKQDNRVFVQNIPSQRTPDENS